MEGALKQYARQLVGSIEKLTRYFADDAISSVRIPGVCADVVFIDEANRIVIERVIFSPDLTLRAHRHPNVSVVDFRVHGAGRFYAGRRSFYIDESITQPMYVPRNLAHGGTVGPQGGAIISLQYWYTWPPSPDSLGGDWRDADAPR